MFVPALTYDHKLSRCYMMECKQVNVASHFCHRCWVRSPGGDAALRYSDSSFMPQLTPELQRETGVELSVLRATVSPCWLLRYEVV